MFIIDGYYINCHKNGYCCQLSHQIGMEFIVSKLRDMVASKEAILNDKNNNITMYLLFLNNFAFIAKQQYGSEKNSTITYLSYLFKFTQQLLIHLKHSDDNIKQ